MEREPGAEVLAAPGARVKQGRQPGLTRQRNGEVSSVHLSASPGCSKLYLSFKWEDCHRDATAMGTEGEEPVSPRRVWRGGKRSKLPVALFSEEVLSVNRACGKSLSRAEMKSPCDRLRL